MKNAYDLTIKHRNMKDKDYYVIRKREREREKKFVIGSYILKNLFIRKLNNM